MMDLAYQLFTNKSALIKHLLSQVPVEEFPPHGPTFLQKANELKSKLPEDIQTRLGVINVKDIYNNISEFRKKQNKDANQQYKTKRHSTIKNRICWSIEEETKIIDYTVALRLTDPLSTMLVLCNTAQEQLPENRRRKILQNKQIPGIIEKISKRLLTVKENSESWEAMKQEKGEQPAPTPVEIVEQNQEDTLAAFSDESLIYYLLNERKAPLSVLLPSFVERISQLWEEQDQLPKLLSLVEEQEEKLDMLLDHLTRSNKPAPAPQPVQNNKNNGGKKLPRFAVCGLWKDKFHELVRACKNYAELRYIDRDMNTPNFSNNDAKTILFLDYMSHHTQLQAVGVCGKDKVVLHKGGVATAINVIINLAKQI